MAETLRVPTDMYVAGSLSASTMTLPSSTVVDAGVASAAKISASKLQHRYTPAYEQESSTTVVTEKRPVHAVKGATGVIQWVRAGVVGPNVGAATIVVDVLKNGTTVLSSTITLNSTGGTGGTAYDIVTGTVSTSALVVDDVIEVSVTATAGGGTLGTGVFVDVGIDEDAN